MISACPPVNTASSCHLVGDLLLASWFEAAMPKATEETNIESIGTQPRLAVAMKRKTPGLECRPNMAAMVKSS